MTYFIKIIVCVNFWCVFLHACDSQSVEPCEVGGEAGACVPLPACAQLVALLKDAATTLEGLRVSRARQCGFDGQNMKVCCPFANPSPPPTPSPPPATRQNDRRDFVDKFPNPDTGCGKFKYYSAPAAWNGKPVKSREMVKWMAILGYKDAPVFWQCGGSIITARHVLTAAHCVKPNLYVVRIGELNLEQEERDASPIDFLVKKAIPHEAYTKHHNDIAVLVLDGTIDFEKSTHVTPICLPLPNPPYAFDDTYDSIFVAGWGETENRGERPSALLYAPLNLLDREECAYAYRNSNVTIDARVLCVGDKEGEHDACNGDSGGPLVRKFEVSTLENNKFIGLHQYQLGIVSYGFRCSLRRFLGVYTNVFYFIPWLEEKVLGRAP